MRFKLSIIIDQPQKDGTKNKCEKLLCQIIDQAATTVRLKEKYKNLQNHFYLPFLKRGLTLADA